MRPVRPRAVSAAALLGALALAASACKPPSSGVWEPAEAEPFAKGKQQVEVLFVGDVSTARGIDQAIKGPGKGDARYPYGDIKPVLDAADLVFGNLECVVSDSEEGKTGKTYAIRSPVKNASVLKDVGFDVVSVANNHALDFSHGGFWSTLREASKQGLLLTGVREADGQKPLIVEVGALKMGFLGYNAHGDEWEHPELYPRPSLYKLDDALADIKKARPLVDVLVVSMHWGPELSLLPWDWQERDARKMIDAGAALVIGHHPHVPEQVEEYKNGLIVYSLGDFLFDKQSPWLRHRTGGRFFLKVKFDGKKRTGFELIPVNHDTWWRPHVQPDQDVTSWVRKKDAAKWRASLQLQKAAVERVRVGGPVEGGGPNMVDACDQWQKKRLVLPGGYLRWLTPRWSCDDEDKRPGDAIARTGETAGTVMREGIWVSPGDDVVRLTFKDVPFHNALSLYAGFTDWVIDNEQKQKTPVTDPVEVTVKSGAVVLTTFVVPFEKGWKDAPPIDTTKLAGTKGELVVEVKGRRRDEPGFVVELTL